MYPSLSSSLWGISTDVFFSGCTFKCKGCHNPELWEFIEPSIDTKRIVEVINMGTRASVVSFMGGEPLQQEGILDLLIEVAKNTNKKISLFTGYEMNQVSQDIQDKLDFLKTGVYQDDNRTPFGSFLTSKNQVMYRKDNGIWVIDWEFKENGNEDYSKMYKGRG